MKWLLCIDNKKYPTSLESGKFYKQLEDLMAEKLSMVRIVDESGEDCLNDKSLFAQISMIFCDN